MLLLAIALVLVLVLLVPASGFVPGDSWRGRQKGGGSSSSSSSRVLLATTSSQPLKTGEFEGVEFKSLDSISSVTSSVQGLGKYSLSATITKAEMNSFLNEYKEEMKRRKVVFPGFRAGKLPPYVMGDVRKYLVCFGLETLIGQLCNLNGLQLCGEKGQEVAFGEDSYYQEIIQPDFRGFDYAKQRDSWREGTDFAFSAQFYAISEEEGEGEGEGEGGGKVIDVQAEKVKSSD